MNKWEEDGHPFQVYLQHHLFLMNQDKMLDELKQECFFFIDRFYVGEFIRDIVRGDNTLMKKLIFYNDTFVYISTDVT